MATEATPTTPPAPKKKRLFGLGCLAVVIIALLILGTWGVGQYNSLVSLDQKVRSQWAQVENAYQRRADLVPNLVETVKGAAGFEQQTYTAVAEARAKAGQVRLDESLVNNSEAFNHKRMSFPTVLIAGFFGSRFAEKAYFTAQPGAETAPKVKF